jgi:hypothetical protein
MSSGQNVVRPAINSYDVCTGKFKMWAMRGLVVVFTLLLFALTGRSLTQVSPSLPEPGKDPFVGTWKANPEKSRPKLDKVRASYERTISRDGDDLVFSSRVKKAHSAGFSENHYRIRCDGLPHQVQCGETSCTTSCTYVAANLVKGETVSPGGNVSYWTREISQDGQEMTISAYTDKARTKLVSVQQVDRVK